MSATEGTTAKPWDGRFSQKTAALVEEFTASVHFDARLARHDIAGSRAHAHMLARQGLLSDEECRQIQTGLDAILQEITAETFVFRRELEDVHMNIERALTEKIGAAGEKLHTGRSRNDQIALDLRLYLREETDKLDTLLAGMQTALVRQARACLGLIMPGYTHLQRAQPVLVSHHLLAYCEMFQRDRERLADGRKRINILPLGAAALAGSGLPLDRESVARELDFAGITKNSMDTVADRDFVVEFMAACSLVQAHLSRLAEELVLWASQEFGFIDIADSHCTGSSIMPQKKNPDVAELIRGKTGRVYGNLMALLTVLKGLPLTYNRDLQEDKEPLFDTVDTVAACLTLAADTISHLAFVPRRLKEALAGGFMTATDLADFLVQKGVPFRRAHGVAGRVVAHAAASGKELNELPLEELQGFAAEIGPEVFNVLSITGSVDSRTTAGGTARERVEEALTEMEARLESLAPTG